VEIAVKEWGDKLFAESEQPSGGKKVHYTLDFDDRCGSAHEKPIKIEGAKFVGTIAKGANAIKGIKPRSTTSIKIVFHGPVVPRMRYWQPLYRLRELHFVGGAFEL
jgi:hypothetical protein